MKIIAERLIAYLKEDSSLVALLGSADNIFPMNMPLRKDKYIVISTNVGQDQNNIPADVGEIIVEAVVNRKIASAHKVCFDIAKRIDVLLNKGEQNISNVDYDIINFVRDNTSGLQIDSDNDEYWFSITYSFILDHSS
jgi:hypothetical protein